MASFVLVPVSFWRRSLHYGTNGVEMRNFRPKPPHLFRFVAAGLTVMFAVTGDLEADERAEARDPFAISNNREGDRVEIIRRGNRPALGIRSRSGIGRATIERKTRKWPERITIRLYLKGLESFSATTGQTALHASVQSHSGHSQRLHLSVNGKEGPPLAKKSPYWTSIGTFDDEGKPTPGLPKKGGYFELTLPAALFKDNPKSLELTWIDFYRG